MDADQASHLLAYTAAIGGRIAAAEFMNEPDVAVTGVLPEGYDAAAYRRDFASFRSFVKQHAAQIVLLAPGTADTADTASNLLDPSAAAVDAISYHYYGMLSERCTGANAPDGALSEPWLAQTDRTLDFYRQLRDRVAPNKPIWLTETAQAACGGACLKLESVLAIHDVPGGTAPARVKQAMADARQRIESIGEDMHAHA